ncbi:MAG TPA: ATP-dependent 6-phosphofructokinase [Armatimonadota bacterium]
MRVGVLTGGGDCPGLNPAIRGAVIRGLSYGWEMVGFEEGWRGWLEGMQIPLTLDVVDDIIRKGGTILGSSRTNPYKAADTTQKALDQFEALGIDALIAIGGDDTLGVANKLFKAGKKTVGVPKTMDNDLSETDYTFGFDSAVAVCTENIDRLHDTALSHRRCIVVEVMGRAAGWVALYAGIAGNADWILIPEKQPTEADLKQMIDHLLAQRERGRKHNIVVVSEGVSLPHWDVQDSKVDAFGHAILKERGIASALEDYITKATKDRGKPIETKSVTFGHIVRGGSPSVFDRILGTRVGVKAAEMVHDGEFGKMAALHGLDVVAVDLDAAVGVNKQVPASWLEMASLFFK